MGANEVDDKLRRIIALHLEVDAGRLSPTVRLGVDL